MSSSGAVSWSDRPGSPPPTASRPQSHAIDVVRALGGSLENHRSRSDRREPRTSSRLYLRHDDRPPRRSARGHARSSSRVRFCSTRPAATSPTPSAATTRPTAAPPRSWKPCSTSGLTSWGFERRIVQGLEYGHRFCTSSDTSPGNFDKSGGLHRLISSWGSAGRPCQFPAKRPE